LGEQRGQDRQGGGRTPGAGEGPGARYELVELADCRHEQLLVGGQSPRRDGRRGLGEVEAQAAGTSGGDRRGIREAEHGAAGRLQDG
jgi:hypothetical protein